MDRPEIFKYLEYRSYLKDYFQFLIDQDPKFSQRWIAQRAGLKSPQLLSMILKGDRKLSTETAQLLSTPLGLNEKEEEYLNVLIELESANHMERQLEILDRIKFQFQNGLFKDLPDSGYEYLKKWYYPVVREFCAIKNLKIDPTLISHCLEISNEEAGRTLEYLIQLGFLKRVGEEILRAEPSLKASDFVSPLLMAQYHLQVIERAFHAMQLKRELRHFESLVFSLPTKQIDSVKEKIRQFIRELDMIAENSPRRDDVFQLSIQFFSLTGGRLKEYQK